MIRIKHMFGKKNLLQVIIAIFVSIHCATHTTPSTTNRAITHQPGQGRLGDHILEYCIAKWIAWKFDLPFLYTSFAHSDLLMLDTLETRVPKDAKSHFKYVRSIMTEKDLVTRAKGNILFVSNLKFTCNTLKGFGDLYRYIINNHAFKQELITMIRPVKHISPIEFPPDTISIAVHVRKGGGFDHPLLSEQINMKPAFARRGLYADQQYPRRFLPDQYYINQIIKLSKMFDHHPLFIHIFTDDQNPQSIVNTFKEKINRPNTIFSCRTHGNKYDKNIVEDLLAMTQFDCLIRPASSFSKVAQLLGNHKVIVYPQATTWINNRLKVTKVGTLIREDNTISYYSTQY